MALFGRANSYFLEGKKFAHFFLHKQSFIYSTSACMIYYYLGTSSGLVCYQGQAPDTSQEYPVQVFRLERISSEETDRGQDTAY